MSKPNNLNARTHGVFSQMILVPGESEEELDALYEAVKEELDPQGPLQQEKVKSVVRNLWRKRQFDRYQKEKVKSAELALVGLEAEIDVLIQFLKEARAGISPLKVPQEVWTICEEHNPREGYDSNTAWLEKTVPVIEEILEERHEKRAKFVKERIIDPFYNDKTIAAGLAIEERLDAKIDRDIVAFGRMKTMQAMGLGRRQNGPIVEHEPTTQIESPPVQPESAELEPKSATDGGAESGR